MTVPTWMVWVGGLALLAFALWCLDAYLYRLKQRPTSFEGRGSSGTLGTALLTVQAVFEPGAEHVLEAREETAEDEDESGDPPEPGVDERPAD